LGQPRAAMKMHEQRRSARRQNVGNEERADLERMSRARRPLLLETRMRARVLNHRRRVLCGGLWRIIGAEWREADCQYTQRDGPAPATAVKRLAIRLASHGFR